MFDASQFRAIVSGERRGVWASSVRAALAIAEFPYTAVVQHRNRSFDAGRDVHRAGVPVVDVGNLTLGGTGKTPLVEWIARWFRARGVRVALVSRGYGAEAGALNDEALELEQKLPDVPHVQNRDRVAAARIAVEELECELILLDDGFQHRRLARDLEIVVLDALEPFGFEHVFPRGTLREPLSGLRRADVIVLSRADLVSAAERARIRERALRLALAADWVEARHAPRALLSSSNRELPIGELAGRRVAAFCGIGNPAGFRRLLEASGYRLVGCREFADHYRYGRADVEALTAWAAELQAEALVTTHKDLVKLRVDQLGRAPLWALAIGLEILSGEDALTARLSKFVPAPAHRAG